MQTRLLRIMLLQALIVSMFGGCAYTVVEKHRHTQPRSKSRTVTHATVSPIDDSTPARSLPYVSRLADRDSFSVWIVDGVFVRDSLDEEFSNFGQHGVFDFIPKNEFWLDREAVPDESPFFIEHLLVERGLMDKGITYDSALIAADQAELAMRKTAGDPAGVAGPNGVPDPIKVHRQLWKTLESGLSVWIIDGRLVRSAFDVDFTEGGHDHVYEFIPSDEIWIDNDLAQAERPFVLFHEIHERNLMANGWPYSKAHEDASRLELYYRTHPNELHLALSAEGWE